MYQLCRLLLIVAFFLIIPLVLSSVYADTINWTGSGDGYYFSDPMNWDLNRVPISTDEILIENDHSCWNPGFTIGLDIDFVVENSLIMGCESFLSMTSNDLTFTNNGLFVGSFDVRGTAVNNGDFVTNGNHLINEEGTDNYYLSADRLGIGSFSILDNYANLTLNGPLTSSGIINNYGIITNNGTIYQSDSEGNKLVNHLTGKINNKHLATMIIYEDCANCGPSLLQNDGKIHNTGDIIVTCGNSLINSGTITGFDPVDMCGDSDSDGILDDIDTLVGEFSNDVSDIQNGGKTYATILDRGEGHLMVITDKPGVNGIRVNIYPPIDTPPGFDTPLTLSKCDKTKVTLNSPDKAILACGSSIIESELGEIEVEFTGFDDTVYQVTLYPPNKIIFYSDRLTFVADENNESLVTISSESGLSLLEPGQTISFSLFCGKPQSDYNIISGTEDNDVLFGTNGDDLIFGFGGDDKIKGKTGSDCIFGGDGNDNVSGGKGSDAIYGENGNDKIHGNNGADVLSGGDGNDKLFGNMGIDTMNGDDGNDVIHGGHDSDDIDGGIGVDKCHGGQGSNTFVNCEDTKSKIIEEIDSEE